MNSPQKANLRLGCGGGGAVLRLFSGGEGMKGGQSTVCKGTALPTRDPPGASLPLHGPLTICWDMKCHTLSPSHYGQQTLLVRLQEDRGKRGAVQSLETTCQLWSFEAHKPMSSSATLGSKKKEKPWFSDFFSRAHHPPHLSEALLESMGEIKNQIQVYIKQKSISTLTTSLFWAASPTAATFWSAHQNSGV